MDNAFNCFKAYDIRGKVPDELNEELAFRIGRAYATLFEPRKVALGHDVRTTSPGLSDALAAGLIAAGVEVLDLGLCGTEEVYFAAFSQGRLGVDGGIMVTASHNPAAYNGMKFVRQQARPVSGDSGLNEIRRLVAADPAHAGPSATTTGRPEQLDLRPQYIDHLLSYVDLSALKPLKLVVNSGNGGAGPVVDLLEKHLPFQFIKIQHTPDGTFPNGIPNPLLPENRQATTDAVIEHGADLGIAWDGDFDRCFLFDEQGGFIEGYYIVGLLARAVLANNRAAKIIHDPRLIWNTRELVEQAGGTPVMSRTGHAFIKERMRAEDAAYGGEMSAHHYFREFGYCDSGMIPWLLICEILCRSGRKLSELVQDRITAYPVSGEINSRIADPDGALERIASFYSTAGGDKDFTDGLSMTFADFRFNVRKSNTEPVLRLNVETRGNKELLEEKTRELLALIRE
jgi:phosphomannomutase/phosphomannomutase/phosphoglucomutase